MEMATIISFFSLTFTGRANLKALLLDMDAMYASSLQHHKAVHDDHGEHTLDVKNLRRF